MLSSGRPASLWALRTSSPHSSASRDTIHRWGSWSAPRQTPAPQASDGLSLDTLMGQEGVTQAGNLIQIDVATDAHHCKFPRLRGQDRQPRDGAIIERVIDVHVLFRNALTCLHHLVPTRRGQLAPQPLQLRLQVHMIRLEPLATDLHLVQPPDELFDCSTVRIPVTDHMPREPQCNRANGDAYRLDRLATHIREIWKVEFGELCAAERGNDGKT